MIIDVIIAASFILNPLCALLFSLNLCFLIIKVSKNQYEHIKGNIILICISSSYIIFSLTWLFAALENSLAL
ncbi:hypothetical protein JFL43_10825 [Viridibacillus sp. YIM B01967]|uniref:PCZ2.2 n=1 Tax=Viridibacillus soli TaxID=2798301 RepID=A0ABS1H8I6_9BACL|nr:hypothetical protein [Viridibacillus soli]MBK3495333.1 hypothetical protein [Viridibacillus soli]